MAFKFEKNIVPIDETKTFGELIFISVEDKRTKYDDAGAATGEIAPRKVTLFSDIQGGTFEVEVSAENEVDSLKFQDKVTISDVIVRPWANIDPNSNSNFAESDVKVKAEKISKVGAGSNPVKQNEVGAQGKVN